MEKSGALHALKDGQPWEGTRQKADAQVYVDWRGYNPTFSPQFATSPKCNWCDYVQRKMAAFKVPRIQIVWLFPQLPAPLWNTGTNLVEKWVNPLYVALSHPWWNQDSVHLGIWVVSKQLLLYYMRDPRGNHNQTIIIRHLWQRRGPREGHQELSDCWWAEWTGMPLNSHLTLTRFLWPHSLSELEWPLLCLWP